MKDSSGGVISVPLFSDTVSKMDEKVEIHDNMELTEKIKKYEALWKRFPSF